MTKPPKSLQRVSTKRLVTLAVALLLLVVFVAENFEPVEVRLFFTEQSTRLAWALLIAALLGFTCGLVVARLRR